MLNLKKCSIINFSQGNALVKCLFWYLSQFSHQFSCQVILISRFHLSGNVRSFSTLINKSYHAAFWPSPLPCDCLPDCRQCKLCLGVAGLMRDKSAQSPLRSILPLHSHHDRAEAPVLSNTEIHMQMWSSGDMPLNTPCILITGIWRHEIFIPFLLLILNACASGNSNWTSATSHAKYWTTISNFLKWQATLFKMNNDFFFFHVRNNKPCT